MPEELMSPLAALPFAVLSGVEAIINPMPIRDATA
jgi:hypothetical protein